MQYKAISGDTWDLIAYKFFGNEWLATDIIAVNPRLARIIVFTGGETINIPEIDTTTSADSLPPWRR